MSVDAAVWDEVPDLLALAMALTGRGASAADLVGQVLAPTQRARRGADFTARALRNQVLQRFVERRASLLDPAEPDLPNELAPIAHALDRLPPLQRAAVVLSYRERATLAETAGVLDRPAASVERSLAAAATIVDATPFEVAATLDALAWRCPDPETVRPAIRRHERRLRTRRRRVRGLVGAVAVAAAAAVVVPTVVIPRQSVDVRNPQEWVLGFDPRAPAGWVVSSRFLQPKSETVELTRSGSSASCQITARASASPAALPTFYRTAKVRGRPGGFANSSDHDGNLDLVWAYAPGAQASISCSDVAEPEKVLLQLARQVRFQRQPLKLPFALATLPAGYDLQFVGHQEKVWAAVLGRRDDWGLIVALPSDRPSGQIRESETIDGRPADVYVDADGVNLCLHVQQQLACLTAQNGFGAQIGRQGQDALLRAVTQVAQTLRFPSDLPDESTWFDARDALPH